MKDREITIYDNYYSKEREQEIRDLLFEAYAETHGYQSPQDIPNSDVWQEIDFQDREQWDEVKDELQRLFKNDVYLLTGTCGRWNGSAQGGSFIHSIQDFLHCIEHMEYIRIYDKNGHLYIHGSHHDGNDDYELKRLTRKGYLLADSNYFAHDRQLHNTLMRTNFYSALPNFAKAIYGV
jgi:hypothetical protein